MKTKIVRDANGEPYTAYIGFTRGGVEVHLDKELADQSGDPGKMMAMEIAVHQEVEDEMGRS